MKKRLTLITGLLLFGIIAFSQRANIDGVVKNDMNEPIPGAYVSVVGTPIGTITDEDGAYSISVPAGSYDLLTSFVGYRNASAKVTVEEGQNKTVDFTLVEGVEFETVVISGSKRPEKLTESPATIQTIFAREIEQYAGLPGDLIARQKGVEFFRAGVANPGLNIRGFNSNFNAKNLQVTDGRFSTLIATGLPFGPLNTSIKEDIEQIEVILGPNATMYGPNAHNGLLNTITKDPRTSEGTTIALNAGNQSQLGARVRHACVINDKLSFKVAAEYFAAEEFDWVDSVYIVRDGELRSHEEFELDNTIRFLRAEGAVYYNISSDKELIFNTGYSNSTFLSPTNVGRNQIKDWMINYYQLRYNSKNFFAQAYYTTSRTDSTYAIDERTKQYYRGIDAGLSPEVGGGDFSYQSGALFIDDSRRLNLEAQYNNTFGKFDLITGVQYQLDMANSHGTYLLDEDENDFINVAQLGGYVHGTYKLDNGWRLLGAARADYHEIYEFNFIPKLGILKVGDMGTWRLTYSEGIAAPTILNMFGNLFGGLILGNAEGFTLADGSTIDRQRVEKISTFEVGWRGQAIRNKLYVDGNAYFNINRDFLSPVSVIGVATLRGDTPVSEVQDLFEVYNGLVATYINFGRVNTYGADLSATYVINDKFSVNANYSYFNYSFDENDLSNDFNNDGVVNFLDFLVNAASHRAGLGLNYNSKKFFGTLFGRWVSAYDYFSSFQIASRSHPDLNWRGAPIIEGQRSADAFNYGPLGGFVSIDLNVGYHINKNLTASVSITNLLDDELREFTAAPPTRRLILGEIRINF